MFVVYYILVLNENKFFYNLIKDYTHYVYISVNALIHKINDPEGLEMFFSELNFF